MEGVVAGVDLAVVVPTLDEELTIGRCVESVGTHGGVEVVVVDGGSGDRTREAARRAGARVIEGARGRGQQLNAGALATRAGRLLFLHADCRLPHSWLTAVQEALDDPQNSLVCFRLRTVSTALSEPSAWGRILLRLFDLRSRGFRLPYGDQGFAVRRDTFDQVGGFEEILLMEDVAFARACRGLGKVCRLPMEITTTARRFENRPFTTALMFTFFPVLYRLGVHPSTLSRWYGVAR
jgi:rSAM/selenodomain-associated transferase 2